MRKKGELKSSESEERRVYSAPKLTSFGEVRNLTEGSSGSTLEPLTPGEPKPPPKQMRS
jgi:hypothetical protein